MRILITGSRHWPDPDVVRDAIANQLEGVHYDSVVVHGDCPTGADAQADAFCRLFGIAVERHPALWSKYGRSAGPKRNQQMVDRGADIVLAFMEEGSRGTKDCVTKAVEAGLPVIVRELIPNPTMDKGWFIRQTILNQDAYNKFMSGN